MAEDTWLKIEREYFVETESAGLGVLPKTVSKVIEAYNRFLQKALLGDSPFVAEDLRLTMLKAGGKVDTEQQDREPGQPDSEA